LSPTLACICDELGITVIPTTKQRGVMETWAGNILERILRAQGAEHYRSVLTSIVETENNRSILVASVLLGVSDVLGAHPEWSGGPAKPACLLCICECLFRPVLNGPSRAGVG
jgi:hypothetical protein